MRMVVIKPVSLKQAVQRLLKVNSKDCAFPNCALMFPRSPLFCIFPIRLRFSHPHIHGAATSAAPLGLRWARSPTRCPSPATPSVHPSLHQPHRPLRFLQCIAGCCLVPPPVPHPPVDCFATSLIYIHPLPTVHIIFHSLSSLTTQAAIYVGRIISGRACRWNFSLILIRAISLDDIQDGNMARSYL
jgi:hypothetical protein